MNCVRLYLATNTGIHVTADTCQYTDVIISIIYIYTAIVLFAHRNYSEQMRHFYLAF